MRFKCEECGKMGITKWKKQYAENVERNKI